MYAPRLGRFLSQDPIGLDGGDVNLLRYVGNDPVNATDPSGLEIVKILVKESTFTSSPAGPHGSGSTRRRYEFLRARGTTDPALALGIDSSRCDSTVTTVDRSVSALTEDEARVVAMAIGNPESERSLATLMTQVRSTPPRGWYSREEDKCHRWIDDFASRFYPQYNGNSTSRLNFSGGLTLELLHHSTVDPKGIVTARSLLGLERRRMFDHSFGRVTFANGQIAYFDLGSDTDQGNFGGDDHWWIGWPGELDRRQGGARVPGQYE